LCASIDTQFASLPRNTRNFSQTEDGLRRISGRVHDQAKSEYHLVDILGWGVRQVNGRHFSGFLTKSVGTQKNAKVELLLRV
jgi:hypothetical protein